MSCQLNVYKKYFIIKKQKRLLFACIIMRDGIRYLHADRLRVRGTKNIAHRDDSMNRIIFEKMHLLLHKKRCSAAQHPHRRL
jgi:hypothetical protein